MIYNNILSWSGFGLIVSLATPVSSLASPSPSNSTFNIIWTACGNATVPRECTRFEVPMDYKDPSAGTASLAVARINATKLPRLGTFFVNPGGPGESFN
jgi:hypothetical protein